MIVITGWTWEYIDEFMTLPRLVTFLAYIDDWPPTHESAALLSTYFGLRDNKSKSSGDKKTTANSQSLSDLAGIPGISVSFGGKKTTPVMKPPPR